MKQVGDAYEYDSRASPIGKGSFSQVFLGSTHCKEDRKKVAIKVIELSRMEGKIKHMLREIDIMRHLKHDNIVRLFDIQYERFGHSGIRLFVVMEYCERGDMSSVEKPLSERQCKEYFCGIMSGLRYLHKRGIVHRDVKPQNVLLTAAGVVKIADFTFARHVEQQQMLETMCGTPLYIAPEIMDGAPYDAKCDLWSLGIMLYQYLYGSHPLGTIRTQGEMIRKLKSVKITYPRKLVLESYEPGPDGNDEHILCRTVRVFSPECVKFLRGLLRHDPRERMDWDTACDHPWLGLEHVTDEDILFPPMRVATEEENQHKPVHAYSAPAVPIPIPPPTPLAPRSIKSRRLSVVRPPPPPQRVTSSGISPAAGGSSSETPWGFQLSGEDGGSSAPPSSGGGGSRIIEDYYATTNAMSPPLPSVAVGNDDSSSMSATSSICKESRVQTQEPSSTPRERGGLLSRSIDTIHRVFTL